MDDKKARIEAARAKLKNKFKGARLGGKGTQRRKKKVTHKSGNTDSKLKNVLKRFGAEVIPEIAEVNMFTDEDKVLTFRNPEGKSHGSLPVFGLVSVGERVGPFGVFSAALDSDFYLVFSIFCSFAIFEFFNFCAWLVTKFGF